MNSGEYDIGTPSQAHAQRRLAIRGFRLERDPERRKQRVERQIARTVDRIRKETPQLNAGDFADQRFDIVLTHADALALVKVSPVPDPQRTHHVVERLAVAGGFADREIERQRHERTLRVVAHDGVRRVLVLPVILDPRIE